MKDARIRRCFFIISLDCGLDIAPTDVPGLTQTFPLLTRYSVRLILKKDQGLTTVQTVPKSNRMLSELPIFSVSSLGNKHELLGPDLIESGLFLRVSKVKRACLPNCQHMEREHWPRNDTCSQGHRRGRGGKSLISQYRPSQNSTWTPQKSFRLRMYLHDL